MVGLLLAVVVSEISPFGRDDKTRARGQNAGGRTKRGREKINQGVSMINPQSLSGERNTSAREKTHQFVELMGYSHSENTRRSGNDGLAGQWCMFLGHACFLPVLMY
jgi:hypothetical protein